MINTKKFKGYPLFSFLLIASILFSSCSESKEAKTSKPNIILIVTDDQGYADLSAYNHVSHLCKTPNMDRIAQNGILFDNAYVTAPVCSPSRAAINTGQYQEKWDPKMFWSPGLPQNVLTIAETLKEAGYQTAKVGKSDFGTNYHNPAVREFPNQHGYDSFVGFSAHAHDYFLMDEETEKSTPDPYGTSASLGRLFVDSIKTSFKDTYSTELFTNKAIEFIQNNTDQPFFLDLSYNAVHHLIHEVPDEYLEKWDVQKVANYNSSYGNYKDYYWDYTQVGKISDEEMRKYFLANLNCLDDNIGRLLDALEATGEMDNTMIILVSDNGGEPLAGANNLPLSGSKYTMHEGGIKVPMILSWPNGLPKEKLYTHRVSTLDIFPTFLEAAGVNDVVPQLDLDGSSLIRPIIENIPSASAESPLFFQFGKQWAIIDQDWKLVLAEDYNPENRPITSQIQLGSNPGVEALYDLAADPAERNNLIQQNSIKAKSLKTKHQNWINKMAARYDHYQKD
ncbi:sulfatase-like hydrolase/transferase [Echinicola sp. CAU 1574]|uniref:Sulfatase-like hydrolase/transferase n=1 Tax=Echinicola arenosa TaxID=2774144 RepID=A0ABR9AL32_9BACT|nr:sulfatase-like hydrolase/transferase [Echinicola arenosa]MBD8489511.1 sulfatase-like hydrolase/transferase [Echinicola arenosa]